MKLLLLALLTFVAAGDSAAAQTGAKHPRLRDESFHSSALGRTMKYRVLVPQGYEASERRDPVLYLLHGLTGDYKDWTTRTNIAEYTRTVPLIVVMPDGENQWSRTTSRPTCPRMSSRSTAR
jgi:poly(3-hydroxybutyrate) depolymerase